MNHVHFATTTSTMDEAKLLAKQYDTGLVTSDEQTKGRGRLDGRTWHSLPKDSLLATFWFPYEMFKAPLPLLTALVVLNTLETWAKCNNISFKHKLELKWPNDILCGNKKLAGILCESNPSTVFAGIGINCMQEKFAQTFSTEPTSIYIETACKPDIKALLDLLFGQFILFSGNNTKWKAEYENRLAWKNKPVSFTPAIDGAAVRGLLKGINDNGAIWLELESGKHEYYVSGELRQA